MNAIVTITGMTCSGKTHLADQLSARGCYRLRSATTRARRTEEAEDAYYFLREEQFNEADMLERVEHNGHWYGIPLLQVQDAGDQPAVAVVDPVGMLATSAFCESTGRTHIPVFLDVEPSVLAGRISKRLTSLVAEKPLTVALREHAYRLLSMIESESSWSPLVKAFAANNSIMPQGKRLLYVPSYSDNAEAVVNRILREIGR